MDVLTESRTLGEELGIREPERGEFARTVETFTTMEDPGEYFTVNAPARHRTHLPNE